MTSSPARLVALSLLAGSCLGLLACTSAPRREANFIEPTARPAQPFIGFGDPLALSTGGSGNPNAARSNSAAQGAAASAPSDASGSFTLYRDIFSGQTANTGTAPSANLAQVSFSLEGADFDPDASRDGRTIVFASTQHRPTPDIYIKTIDSRVVTQLTSDPASDVMPKISPDGTRVAFTSNRAGNWDIYVMPLSGGRAIQITSSAADDLHPSWSPDGNSLVFCRLGEVSGQWEMWVTDVGNPGIAKFIGYGLFPEWSPVARTGQNGADRIAFQKSRERGDRSFGIWTIDYKDGQSGNATEIVSSPIAACINPSWSPDGNWIAFATVPNPSQWTSGQGRPSASHLWMVDLSGNNRISLTSDSTVDLLPTWGPNNRIFFVSDRGGTDNIWSLDTTPVIKLAATNSSGGSHLASGPQRPASGRTPSGSGAVVTAPTESPSTEH
jgi:TolB protein